MPKICSECNEVVTYFRYTFNGSGSYYLESSSHDNDWVDSDADYPDDYLCPECGSEFTFEEIGALADASEEEEKPKSVTIFD
jgi:hypothetical protein|tara:strand:+ start:367 stop:612 length:246 start_codon:yes stop_codon:yes gene_type:complete